MRKFTRSFKNMLLLAGLSVMCTSALAQEPKGCGLDGMLQNVFAKYPELKAQHEQAVTDRSQYMYGSNVLAKTTADDTTTVYYIPMVFHIIHQYGAEDITDAQVKDAVAILNRDYLKLNSDAANIVPAFVPIASNPKIQFRLATLDPQGNCTNGIEHIYSHMTIYGDDFSKLNSWPQNRYLNVWIVKTMGSPTSSVAGYAYYPSAIGNAFMMSVDGVIILHEYVGSIGTASPYNSRALTHEVGHYLSLPHTWGDTNNPGTCGDDGIYDTPRTKGHYANGPGYCTAAILDDAVCDSTAISKPFRFTRVTTTSGTTDTTNIIRDSVVRYAQPVAVGVSSNSTQNAKFVFSDWAVNATNTDHDTTYANHTGSIDLSKYYEFTVTPRLGVKLSLSNVKFNFQRNGTGVRTFAMRSSADGYASNLPVMVAATSSATIKVKSGNTFYSLYDTSKYARGCSVNLGGASFTSVITPITFRLYGWNAEDASGTFLIDTVVFNGLAMKVENVQNYMEYSYCTNMFTRDQRKAMRYSLASTTANRSNLVTNANHLLTGTTGTAAICSPLADFKANKRSACQGISVAFTALPRRAAVTSYSWTFSNGTPATSTSSVPNVVFNTPGWQQVSLTVANSAGSDTKTETQSIYISPNWADITGPYSEDVETSTAGLWIIDNPENNAGFVITGNAGYSGSHSFYLNTMQHGTPADPYYDQHLGQNKDAIISPKYNLNYMSNINFSFKYACVTRGGSAVDIKECLTVYRSTDCGATWTNIYAPGTPTAYVGTNIYRAITGGALANNGNAPGTFVPSSLNQWVMVNIPLTFPSGGQGNVRFKIEYTSSDVSNSIYIDDININGTVGINENVSDYFNLNVYPNPNQHEGDLTVDYFSHGKKVAITITDMLGRQVYGTVDENPAGAFQKHIPGSESKMVQGMYFICVSDGTNTQIKKLIVN